MLKLPLRSSGQTTPRAEASPVVPPPSRGDAFLAAVIDRLTRMGSLPRRMAQALALHVEGWPPEAAAQHMGCTRNTYRNHLAHALRRVGADAPSELFRVLARDLDELPPEAGDDVGNLAPGVSPDMGQAHLAGV